MRHRAEVIRQAREELTRGGIGPALRALNSASFHRFTALYRFEGSTLRNIYLVDRDDPTVESAPDLPVLESYCVFVRNTARKFSVDHARQDERVNGHPKQEHIQSYCGIPLFENGELYGTLCHFDYEAVPITTDEVLILEEIASDLIGWIRRRRASSTQVRKDVPVTVTL